MATLHLLSHSPFGDSRFASCLALLGRNDALLLTGDAVHALRAGSTPWESVQQLPEGIAVFALDEDLTARGIAPSVRIQPVNYPGFVELCCRYEKVNSWL